MRQTFNSKHSARDAVSVTYHFHLVFDEMGDVRQEVCHVGH